MLSAYYVLVRQWTRTGNPAHTLSLYSSGGETDNEQLQKEDSESESDECYRKRALSPNFQCTRPTAERRTD